MLKPVCPNMATTTPPRPAGAQTAQKQHAGLLKLDAQPSAARIPSSRGRGTEGLCLGAASLHSGHLRGIGPPNREPGRTLIPGDGAAGDQEAQNRPACPAMAATRRLRAVPSQRLSGAMISGAPAVCNRQVTSTSIHMANPGPVIAPAVTHRYKRTHCLWLEQFQIADSARLRLGPTGWASARRSTIFVSGDALAACA
jgi:hypothetical protein